MADAPVILALDLASKCGMAWGEARRGAKPFIRPLTLGVKGSSGGEKALALVKELRALLKVVHPYIVLIEQPLNVGVLNSIGATIDTAKIVYGLPMVAEMAIQSSGIYRIRYVSRQDALQHFTGQRSFKAGYDIVKKRPIKSRDMGKAAVMNICRMRGWPVENDDCADAACLFSYGMSLIDPKLAAFATPLFARDPAEAGSV